jgi:rhodanese-related sulfurtransferase
MHETISREEPWELIQSGAVVVLEALPQDHFDLERLPGAQSLPLEGLAECVSALVSDKSSPVVTYCSNSPCSNSKVAASALRSARYANVRVFEGGKQEWIDAGLPVEGSSVEGAA